MSKKKKLPVKFSKKQLIAGVVVLLLIVGALVAGMATQWFTQKMTFGQGNSRGSSSDDTGSGEGPTDAFGNTEKKPPQSVQEAASLQDRGQYQQAEQKITETISKSTDPDEKYQLYLQLGLGHANQQKWQLALNTFAEAEKLQKTFTITRLMGEMSEQLGNKPQAIMYFKAAIPLINPESPMRDADKRILENRIKALQGNGQ